MMDNYRSEMAQANVSYVLAALLVVVLCLSQSCSTKNVGDLAGPVLKGRVMQVAPVSARAGSSVLLTGHGFGTDATAVSVMFGDREAVVLSVSDTRLEVQVPLDAGSPLKVTIAGKEAIISAVFSYITETLSVSGFTPQGGPPGTQVEVSGDGFGEIKDWLEVSIGSVAAEVLSCAPEVLYAAIPASAVDGLITVRRGEQVVQSIEVFTVTEPIPPAEPPRLDSFAPSEVYPMDEVRLSGGHFGTDLESLHVYVGDSEARVVALADNELIIRPVPGTASGTVRVVTAGGEAQSAGELAIKPYPEYFVTITDVSTHLLGPGGILSFVREIPPFPAGRGMPTLGGQPVKYLARLEGDNHESMNQIGLDLDGEYYLGVPNKLKDEDMPEGAEEDIWVTVYYEPVITVTTEGMNPPQTTGLEPFEIYGSSFSPDSAYIGLLEADYTSPIAVLADGVLIMYYNGDEAWAAPDRYIAQGGLSVMFNYPPELFELGEHSIMVATAQGYSVANPGYRVLSLDEVEIYADSMTPQTARAGDLITLSGKNLHWKAAGRSYGMSPHEVRVGGVRMPVVPARWLSANTALDETQFLLIGDAVSGEIEIDIQENEHKQVVRTIKTGLTLNVDRDYLDGFERYYVAKDSVEIRAFGDLLGNRYNGLAETGELYVAYREMVGYDEEYEKLGYFTSAGYTDLGRIDRAPIVFPGYSGGAGTSIFDFWVTIMPDGEPRVMYYGIDSREQPHAVEYWDLRMAVYNETGTDVYPFILTNSETGEGIEGHPLGITGAFDELGNYWGLKPADLLKWDGDGWEIAGPSMPETMHNDPIAGDIRIYYVGPMFAESSGHLKLYGRVFTPGEYEHSALYFIERQPDGEWEFTQVLGREEYPTAWTFDREGLARVFTNDTEKFYIRREENGFAKEVWADIPYPAGSVWPENKQYVGENAIGLSLEVEYDHLNRPVGRFSCKLSTTWEDAIEDHSGTYVVTFMLYDNGSGDINFEPVGAYVLDYEPWCSGSRRMEGQVIDTLIVSEIELSPSGNKLVVTGWRDEYELVDTQIYRHTKGVYVYSRSL
ncbi:IPT/TIG domain-containing protein [bacterium]|nr:IPT/TIG domain-containing protein [bacterium]